MGVHRPTAKGLPLHRGGAPSVHFPSQPEAVQHSQNGVGYKLINCYDWQCLLALTQCSRLGLHTAGEFTWLPVVSDPKQNNPQFTQTGVINHTVQAPAMVDI